MPSERWMIYGANGYTGKLIAQEAEKRGLNPILAGRNRPEISGLAKELDLEFRIFSLESPSFIIENLADIHIVLHCAGPFSATSAPMVRACLASQTHYLDITGEIDVFEAIRKRHQLAVERGLLLMPGVGFDVVPTDCLALNLKKLLPDATELILAFHSEGGPSQGTAHTMIEALKLGCRVRENGIIISVPWGYKVKEFPLDGRARLATTIPWGDVSTAFYSTGIRNIEVYKTFRRSEISKMKWLRLLKPLLATDLVQSLLKSKISSSLKGPNLTQRTRSKTYIWGQVRNDQGTIREGHLTTPNGYDVTVQSAVGIVQYLLKYDFEPGVQTPARVMGEHFIRTLPGVELKIS